MYKVKLLDALQREYQKHFGVDTLPIRSTKLYNHDEAKYEDHPTVTISGDKKYYLLDNNRIDTALHHKLVNYISRRDKISKNQVRSHLQRGLGIPITQAKIIQPETEPS